LPKKCCVVSGINIFVLPDINYFVVFTFWLLHGKREWSERSHRKRKWTYRENFKLVINLRNWAISWRNNDWILIDNSSCSCATDPKCTTYIIFWQRKIWNGRLQTVANHTRSDNKLGSVSWNGISRSLRDLKIHFGIEFYFVALFEPFHIFMSRRTLASPRTKIIAKFVEKLNLKTVWQKFISKLKKKKLFQCEMVH